MSEEDAKIISALNDLIETCKDGQKGFSAAADLVQDPKLQQLFRGYAGQRATFAAELQTEVRRYGGHPERSGTVAGALHRGWLNIKSAVLGQDEAAVIAECESGEDAALKNYEEATSVVLPPTVAEVVARQYKEIKDARQRIGQFKPDKSP
jgi:uncharacterized protein (TIGR02284 family)